MSSDFADKEMGRTCRRSHTAECGYQTQAGLLENRNLPRTLGPRLVPLSQSLREAWRLFILFSGGSFPGCEEGEGGLGESSGQS